MEDKQIIQLYFDRSPEAVGQTAQKYEPLFLSIASNILQSPQDVEECVNDTYLTLWNRIPPECPVSLSAFAAKITRNLALKRLEQLSAKKRGAEVTVSFDELSHCLQAQDILQPLLKQDALHTAIMDFLQAQSPLKRVIFLRRYFFFDSIKDIADCYGLNQNKIKSMLMRTRNKLKDYLILEGLLYE